jgi:hypothetical protein
MNTTLTHAAERQRIAHQILADLQLIEKWRVFGNPIIVGAVSYGLVVAPDIDMEIFCDEPKIQDGFAVLQACALHPRVRKARFSNKLDEPDEGLYWQLGYRHEDGQEWKIDMWSVRRSHPGPWSAVLVEPMQQALTDETRRIILELKEQILLDATLYRGSINLYRAVLDDGVQTVQQYRTWLEHNSTTGLVAWMPRITSLSGLGDTP